MRPAYLYPLFLAATAVLFSCKEKQATPSASLIKGLSLKKGALISCGPADQQLGSVAFSISGSDEANNAFNLGLKLLHSFEYDEAEKVFADIIDKEPQCAMAYWGVAMSSFHALWAPPSEPELKKGTAAITIARTISRKSEKEKAYIEAIAAFYSGWEQTDHRARCLRFEEAMKALYSTYPADKEAAIFYALALNAAADPADKSFGKQKKAGAILNSLYPNEPNHPGVTHYLIHTYDSPELASLGLSAARKYASIAPSSAHALHMPSHIFTRMGLWDEGIQSNQASVNSAQCYAQQAGIKGHWDEELHGLDYLVYAYLQKGENDLARKQWDYLKSITTIQPANFKVAYASASIPARFVLENKLWKQAATLELPANNVAWDKFAWQKAIFHFARFMGAFHTTSTAAAEAELQELKRLHQTLVTEKDAYKAGQVLIQIKTAEAWQQLAKGHNEEALLLMKQAADMEDMTEKHPVTPGEVLPAKELLGEMLLRLKQYEAASRAFEDNLKKHPNRFNGLYGAGQAAERAGHTEKAKKYYNQLLALAGQGKPVRPEIKTISAYLNNY